MTSCASVIRCPTVQEDSEHNSSFGATLNILSSVAKEIKKFLLLADSQTDAAPSDSSAASRLQNSAESRVRGVSPRGHVD